MDALRSVGRTLSRKNVDEEASADPVPLTPTAFHLIKSKEEHAQNKWGRTDSPQGDTFKKQKDLENTLDQQRDVNNSSSVWHAAAYKRVDQFLFAAFNKAALRNEVFPFNETDESLKLINEIRGVYGETLLHIACLYSNFEVAKYLIDNFPNLINQGYQGIYAGETALHFAVVHGDIELMKILLKHIDKGAKDSRDLASEVETFVEMVSPDNRETKTIKRVQRDGKETIVYERKIFSSFARPTGTTTTTRVERQFLTLDEENLPALQQEDEDEGFSFPQADPEVKGTKIRTITMKSRIKANANCAVTGEFFSLKKHNPGGSVYFGDHPLAFAVCLKRPERKEIIRLLIKNGARLDLTDRYGNNLLHLCVYHEDVEMYNYICDLFDLYRPTAMKQLNEEIQRRNTLSYSNKQAGRPRYHQLLNDITYDLEKSKNNKGKSPLNYAIQLGKKGMVESILARRKVLLWKFGPVAQVAYPLEEIDTFGDPTRKMTSGLNILVYTSKSTTTHRAILESTPFKEIMQHKWDHFAKYIFLLTFLHYVTHLFAIIWLVVRHPSDWFLPANHVCLAYIIFNSVIFFVREIHDLFLLRTYFFREEGSRLFSLINISSCLLFIAAIPLRVYGLRHQEDMVVSTAGLLAFINVLYFARGMKQIGHYVVILRRVVITDLFQFLVIYIVFMLGFGLGFLAVFRDVQTDPFEDYPWTLLTLFKMTLFAYDEVTVRGTQNTGFAVTLLVIFSVTTGILMLNLLVATINNSYASIKAESELQWHLERSSIILFMERRIYRWVVKRFNRLRVGKPGVQLGIDDKHHYYLVISESSDGHSEKRSKRLRNLFRHAATRVCLVFFRRRIENLPDFKPFTFSKRTNFLFLANKAQKFDARNLKTMDTPKPDELAEKLVFLHEKRPKLPPPIDEFEEDFETIQHAVQDLIANPGVRFAEDPVEEDD